MFERLLGFGYTDAIVTDAVTAKCGKGSRHVGMPVSDVGNPCIFAMEVISDECGRVKSAT